MFVHVPVVVVNRSPSPVSPVTTGITVLTGNPSIELPTDSAAKLDPAAFIAITSDLIVVSPSAETVG